MQLLQLSFRDRDDREWIIMRARGCGLAHEHDRERAREQLHACAPRGDERQPNGRLPHCVNYYAQLRHVQLLFIPLLSGPHACETLNPHLDAHWWLFWWRGVHLHGHECSPH